jgi:ABC-2 type transport system permease protein
VPIESLPTPLRIFAEWNPVSAVTQSARNLFGNTSPLAPPADVWPMQNPEMYTLIWTLVLVAVFAPISVHLYKRTVTK